MPTAKNSLEMENHVFLKAKSKVSDIFANSILIVYSVINKNVTVINKKIKAVVAPRQILFHRNRCHSNCV